MEGGREGYTHNNQTIHHYHWMTSPMTAFQCPQESGKPTRKHARNAFMWASVFGHMCEALSCLSQEGTGQAHGFRSSRMD